MAKNKNDLDELMNLDSDDNNNINENMDDLMNLDNDDNNNINEDMDDLMNLDSQIEEDVNTNVDDLNNQDSFENDDMMNDLMNMNEDSSDNDDIMNDLMNLDSQDNENKDQIDENNDEFLDLDLDSEISSSEFNDNVEIDINQKENEQNDFENIEFMEENSTSEDESLMPEDDLSSLGLAPIENDDNQEMQEIQSGNKEKNDYSSKDDTKVQKKKPKYFKYIIVAIATLGSFALVLSTLSFMGFFEKEVIEKEEVKKDITKVVKKYKFNIKDINVTRLNTKLSLLTKYEIIESEDTQKKINEQKDYQKTLEEKNEELSKKNKSYETSAKIKDDELEALKNKLQKNNQDLREKLLKTKEALLDAKIKQETLLKKNLEEIEASNIKEEKEQIVQKVEIERTMKNKSLKKTDEEIIISQNIFLSFIKVKNTNSVVYKSLIDKIELVNNQIELCRDHNNNIEVLIGPFKDESKRSEVLSRLDKTIDNKAYKMDLTQEEFNKRCKY